MAAKIAIKDPRVLEWDDNMAAAFQSLSAPDSFMGRGMDPEAAGICAYSYVKFLMKNSRNFQNLLSGLRQGKKFDDVFTSVYGGPPAALTVSWYKQGPAKSSRPSGKSAGK
jgi:hypothetical protein